LWSGHSGSSMPDWEKWRPIRPTRLHQPRSRDSPSWVGCVSCVSTARYLDAPLSPSSDPLLFSFSPPSLISTSSSLSTSIHQSNPSQWAGSLVCYSNGLATWSYHPPLYNIYTPHSLSPVDYEDPSLTTRFPYV
jgi:hypothetical protein